MRPNKLIKLKFDEKIFIKSKIYPVKSVIKLISEYPIHFKFSKIPNKKQEFNISCFNLDKFREKKVHSNKIELE